jgi:hypothetical protein
MVNHGTLTRDNRPKWKLPMDPELVDRIYESSVVPELWPSVLDELGHIAECTGGSLFITKNEVQFWTASPQNRDRAEKVVSEG